MSLTTRVIAGILKDANGTLLTSTAIALTPASFYGEGGVMILPQTETVTTDGSGAYTVTLQCPSSGFITYHCAIGPARFNFDLEDGAATSLDELFNYTSAADGSSLAVLLATFQQKIQLQEDGSAVGSSYSVMNFVGADVTVSAGVAKISINAGSGGSGSVTSQELSVAVAALQSADAALSARIDGVSGGGSGSVTSQELSVIAAGLSTRATSINAAVQDNSADVTSLKNRVSANSATISNAVSAIAANSADVTSLKNRVSANSAIVSNAVSAIQANSANNTSSEAALSTRIDTISNAISGIVAGGGISVTSNEVSIIAAGLSVRIDTNSADVTSLKNRVSANSALVSDALSAIQANSADVTSLKNRVSANSALISDHTSAIQANSADVTSLKNRVSGISATVSTLSADMTSVKSVIGTKASIASPSFTTAVNVGGPIILSGPDNALKTLDRASALTYAHWYSPTTGVAAIYTDTAARNIATFSSDGVTFDAYPQITSTLDAPYDATVWDGNMQLPSKNAVRDIIETTRDRISANSALLSTTASALSTRIDTVSNALSAKKLSSLTDVSVTSPVSAQFLVYKSADGKWTNSTIAPAGASVTSAEHLSVVDRVSAVSALVSTVASALSARINTVSNAVSVLSTDVSLQISTKALLRAANDFAFFSHTSAPTGAEKILFEDPANGNDKTWATFTEIFSVFATGGSGSVTSAEHLSVVDRVSALSVVVSNAVSAITTNSADVTSLKNRVSANSAALSDSNSAIQANSADVTSLKNRVSANSAAVSTLSADFTSLQTRVGTNSADVTSIKDRVSANSATLSNAQSAIQANSADVTSLKAVVSNAISAIVANSATLSNSNSAIQANSADVTSLKNRVSANSALVSDLTSAVQANSADVTSLKNRVSANSAALSVAQADITSIKNNISAIPTSVITFTNKRITKRVAVSVSATGGVVTPNFDNFDMNIITAQGAALSIAAPAGTATEGQSYVIRLRDDGTGRSINYNAIYRAFAASLPTITSANKTLYLGMMRNSTENTYDVDWVTQL